MDRSLDPPEWVEPPECTCGCCDECGWPLEYLFGLVDGPRLPGTLVAEIVRGSVAPQ